MKNVYATTHFGNVTLSLLGNDGASETYEVYDAEIDTYYGHIIVPRGVTITDDFVSKELDTLNGVC